MNIDHNSLFSLIDSLLITIKDRGKRYDQIIAVSRGGLFLGQYLAYGLNIPLNIIHASSYDDKTKLKSIKLSKFLLPLKGQTFLIVDDIYDSGRTIQHISNVIVKQKKRHVEIDTAVIVDCQDKATYQGTNKTNKEWVYFPWDKKP